MTKLGEYLDKKSVNRAAISRRTGISTVRLSELCNNPKAHLRAKELYLIALAIDVDACDMLNYLYIEIKPNNKTR